ncbi:hypothetical protein ABB37_05902 [Leptomonas pyrrhocoris]|uniref:Uncharacterized protein n=1 Tax=Leptomonas pyrrhocoris TaxID=157538 RepID=A0A0M9FZ03_LEPPY|nr:hypothetical protein ABB37_05902 [Leptomonas pyrrhocoris]XP_015657248.1 hypothetical protein ABB37_05902 [Leptomonas pyrrhocoris]KPA78808.1 hypothetical protein ABB37_05902 [Leptomonas pyrrhocoris]KPA78809.1 hypothetical protein ABB37_05902 [Leptomonas pyrrhocoris]|eukprot:XP_015657247.1 hypothetical protein ABB37_05902 [Leptomonas pyrrhocoris]
MPGHDNDIFVILTLWLLYIGIHVCMDFFERRAQRSLDDGAAEEALRRPNRIVAEVLHGDVGGYSIHTRREIRVVVVGTVTDTAALMNTDPCEGALVPDATGRVPQLPEPVHYGEASYAPRMSEDAVRQAVVVEEPQEEKPPKPEVV